jgi:hypothetical protein
MKGRHMIDQQAEERHAVLMAVQGALTAQEREQFMDTAIRRWPMFENEGYTPADVLDYTLNYDEFLSQTEPFYAQLRADSPVPGSPATPTALHALILLGQRLTVPAVLKLLQRAGLTGEAEDTLVTGAVVAEVVDELMRSWSLAECSQANAPVLDEARARQLAMHAMARLQVIRERDHIDPLGG